MSLLPNNDIIDILSNMLIINKDFDDIEKCINFDLIEKEYRDKQLLQELLKDGDTT